MALNDYIKDDARKVFADNFGKGRWVRKLLRNVAKNQLQRNKGKLESPLGKMRSRQERKAMAKSLGIPFNPRYNGPTYRKETKLVEVESKKGIKYLQTTTEVK